MSSTRPLPPFACVARGATHTPKQMILDKKGGKLYWCDREGRRVMRCNLDGLQLAHRGGARRCRSPGSGTMAHRARDRPEIWTDLLVAEGSRRWRVRPYLRANVEIPAGQTAATRSDIEIFFDGLPEPIDLELDHKNRLLYWTGPGDPPRGNTTTSLSSQRSGGPSHGGDRCRATFRTTACS